MLHSWGKPQKQKLREEALRGEALIFMLELCCQEKV
jgi:hypothetical protein